MSNIFRKLKNEKDEYKQYQKRLANLPKDYQDSYQEINEYMLRYGTGDMKFIRTFYDLIEMFEEANAEGKKAAQIVGKDISTFSESLLKSIPEINWTEKYKKKVSAKINKKFNKGGI